ncbi:MAG TPA: hypothetical protein VK824_10605, partial [Planctomycetota bacterium]|nr:hypothetical protein [Planctomycetota bacterium]
MRARQLVRQVPLAGESRGHLVRADVALAGALARVQRGRRVAQRERHLQLAVPLHRSARGEARAVDRVGLGRQREEH